MRVAVTDVEGPLDLVTDLVSGGWLRRFLGWLTSLRDRLEGLLSPGMERTIPARPDRSPRTRGSRG